MTNIEFKPDIEIKQSRVRANLFLSFVQNCKTLISCLNFFARTSRLLAAIVTIGLLSGCAALPSNGQSSYLPQSAAVDQSTGVAEDETILAVSEAQPEAELVPADLWDRVSSGFQLYEDQTAPHYARVDKWREWYNSRPNKLKQATKRAKPYIYYILQELEKRDMPQELALLPIVESGYDPYAFSWARAAGLWQIMPKTGTYLGLRQDWWYDGRRDVVAATDAALNYLEYLHKFFDGDWMKAIAAYNAGEGTVLKAVKANRKLGLPEDYWSLTKLRQETLDYVPKLLAVSQLVSERHVFDTELHETPDEPYFEVVEIPGQLDLLQMSQMSGVKMRDLQRLNAGFNQWSTAPEGPHRVLIPAKNSEQFKAKLAKLTPAQYVRWKKHTVSRGESVEKLAKRYGSSAEAIRYANALAEADTLSRGQQLLIPKGRKDLIAYQMTADQLAVRQRSQKEILHTVMDGESLWKLATSYKVTMRQIQRWNKLGNAKKLEPGSQLVIKSGTIPKELSTIRKVSYRARKRDTLESIAKRYNVTVESIRKRNKLSSGYKVKPGKWLKIDVDVTLQTAGL